ncbi:MAG TPA: FtsQ-type POTRA domain-containing protein [Candidatus Anoxymicrobiaceae bacterium]
MKKLKKPAGAAPRIEVSPGTGKFFKRLVLGICLFVVAGCMAVVWLALFTGVCSVRNVTVTGNKNLTSEYVKQLSGIASYKNLVTLPVGKIAQNLESDPWVRKAHVGRHLLHTVNIKVDERQPVALLDFGGTGFLVDGQGYIITGIATDQFPEIPRIHGGDATAPKVGERITDANTLECVKVIAGMPASIQSTLLLGNPFDGRGQVYVSRQGFNIIYGHEAGAKQKNDVLQAILIDISNNHRQVAYVDVRVPDSPVIMPR